MVKINKLNRFLVIAFLFALLSVMFGCSSDNSGESYNESATNYNDSSAEFEVGQKASEDRAVSEEGAPSESNSEQSFNVTDRKIIYHANLSIEVNDYHKVETQIQEKVSSLGGYVVESSVYTSGRDRITGNLVVKVPQASFHSFINEVETASIKVFERNVSGKDVTEEYIDLDSRIKSKRVVEERLLGFLEKAEQTEDLLKISNDLAKVQEEIEQLLGRMNYLNNNIEYSTVSLHLSEEIVEVQSIQGNKSLNTWLNAKSLFMDSLNGIISFSASVIVFLIGRSPILLPLAVIGLVVVFIIKKRNKTLK